MRLLAWARTLRGRVLSAVAVGIVCQLGALGFEVVQFQRIGASITTVNDTWLPLARVTARMEGQVARPRAPRLEELVAEARAALDASRGAPTDVAEAATLRTAREILDDIERLAVNAGEDDASKKPVRDEITQLSALAEARVAALSKRAARAQEEAVRVSLLLVALSAPLGVALLWAAGSALRPVRTLTTQVRQLEAGERPGPIDVGGDDEIGGLARAFDSMARSVDERDRNLQALSLQLRQVLDSLFSGVVVAVGSRVSVANRAAAQLWGMQEGDALSSAVEGLSLGRHELRVDDRVHDVFVAPFGSDGRILVGEDVTERLADRERLVRSERLALVGQLLAQVTHEVRNPLNAMSLHAELLAEEVTDREQQAILATMLAEIRRLEDVTERYLDLARRRAPELAPEDPLALAQSVVGLEDERLRRQGVEVRVDGGATPRVEIDGNVLRRALLNLVRNAAEAGATHIRLAVSWANDELSVVVADDGPGMDLATSTRVFEPFFSTKARGTGLGLAVSRQGVEDLGGSIVCRSEPGAGTTFEVTIPARRAAEDS